MADKKRVPDEKTDAGKKYRIVAGVTAGVVCAVLLIIMAGIDQKRQEPAADRTAVQESGAPRLDDDTAGGIPSDAQNEGDSMPSLEERADASYERWLAAAMITALSFQHTDFHIEHIYCSSETDVNDKMSSEGVYLVYSEEGETHWIHSVPIENPRQEAGTTDISAADLGYATYDQTSPADISHMAEISVEELDALIRQSLLVSLYEN